MLTAIKDNQTIFVYRHSIDELKLWSSEKKLECPDCRDLLIFRECSVKQNHFAHISKDCSYPFREPESIEHESGKMSLFKWLITQFGENDCETERHIPISNQRADTFVIPHNMAVEFQCSPIQELTWLRRHELYQSVNIKDIWILGYSMHKYQKDSNPYIHKLNQLEQILLKEYGRLIYYDVLSDYFVILTPHSLTNNTLYGHETFYRMNECSINTENFSFQLKYDYFLKMQQKRKQIVHELGNKAKETDKYLKNTKGESSGEKVLATKPQIKFIKDLLSQRKMTIPYKLHGLLQSEADAIIKELLAKKAK